LKGQDFPLSTVLPTFEDCSPELVQFTKNLLCHLVHDDILWLQALVLLIGKFLQGFGKL